MKPMLKFHKGPIVLLSLAFMLFGTAACRPSPSDPVEYLHREDAIIIQMLSLGEGTSEIDRTLAVPEFTLYGDGTLIYKHETADGTRLLQTLLPEDAVLDLLENIVDEGFLDFNYDQPSPEGASGETTFLYAHTLDRANAVRVRGVNASLPEDAVDEFDQYGKIQTFVEMLRALDPVAIGAEEPVAYVPDEYQKVVRLLDETGQTTTTAVSRGSAAEGELAERLRRDPNPTLERLYGPSANNLEHQTDYETYFAPLLPYHENFPEFELQ